MKYRNGFVTNSSSTSYTCEISGSKETFYDGCDHRDYGFVICDQDHTILDEYVKEVSLNEKFKYLINTYDNETWIKIIEDVNLPDCGIEKTVARLIINKNFNEISDEMKEEFLNFIENDWYFGDILGCECPICCMDIISQYDLVDYLKKKTNISESEVLNYVKSINKRRRRIYNADYIEFACKYLSTTVEEIEKEIKNYYKSYKEFKKYLKEKR